MTNFTVTFNLFPDPNFFKKKGKCPDYNHLDYA